MEEREKALDDTESVGSHEKKRRGKRLHTFASRQPCVISARCHVAFQCIISTGKMSDMQNQISLEPLFRCTCISPSSFSSLFLNVVISVSLSLSLSPLLPSVFSILFVRSVAADPAFVSPCCCCSYCTTVVPVTFGTRPLCGTRRCTKHFSLFHSWTTR